MTLINEEKKMIELSQSAREEIAQAVKKADVKKAVRVYIAGHG